MASRSDVESVCSEGFLTEVHHLLWVDPFDNDGVWDEGWNCRDHALVVGCLLKLMRHGCAILHGEACFVQGPVGAAPPQALAVPAHSWLGIDNIGFLDVSPRLSKVQYPDWRGWPFQCVLRRRCVPTGRLVLARTRSEYERQVGEATRADGARAAIYFGKKYQEVTKGLLLDAFARINSPLTDRLRQRHDDCVYAKAVLHLYDFLNGDADTLTGIPQEEAWERVAARKGNAVHRIATRGRLEDGILPDG